MARKRSKITADEEIAITLRAARIFVGDAVDDETPISAEEAKVIAEFRAQFRRPSKAEIAEIAERIARGSR